LASSKIKNILACSLGPQMGWIEEEKNGYKSGDTVPSRYLDSKFKKVTQEIKHYRYLAHTRTCVSKIFL
jgi:hypothetical protein